MKKQMMNIPTKKPFLALIMSDLKQLKIDQQSINNNMLLNNHSQYNIIIRHKVEILIQLKKKRENQDPKKSKKWLKYYQSKLFAPIKTIQIISSMKC
jgi:hypothetical protein